MVLVVEAKVTANAAVPKVEHPAQTPSTKGPSTDISYT